MQMIMPWDRGISQYQSEFKALRAERPQYCAGCGCRKFHKWGKYERYVIEEDGDSRISVRRVRCVKCGKTHSYLPSFCVSRTSYSIAFIMTILKALILKLRISLGERQRRAYAFLRRFRDSKSLWLTYLRARGLEAFPAEKEEWTEKIFCSLLARFERDSNFLSGFLWETGRHFMSIK